MQIETDSELPIFVRDPGTGRFVFNPKAVVALGVSPDELAQRGYPVDRQISSPALAPDGLGAEKNDCARPAAI